MPRLRASSLMPFWFALLLFSQLGASQTSRADLFVLTQGGQVEGELQNVDEDPRQTFVIKTPEGGLVTLSRTQVAKRVDNTVYKRYEEFLPKMPNTVNGHAKMAEWCAKNSLTSQKEYHLREILKIEPDHDEARRLLGYQRRDGRWMTIEDFWISQGYTRHQGVWRLQQDLELFKAREHAKQEELTWRREVRRLRGKIGDRNGDTALEELKAIRNPAAAPILAELLNDKKEPVHLRRVYVELLGRMDAGAAYAALCQRALLDDDSNIRDKCLDQLVAMKSRQVFNFFVLKLDDKDNTIVNRAGLALGRLKEIDATVPLIDALTTKHKRQIGSGSSGSISPVFSGDGGGGLSMGGGAKVVNEELSNQAVHSALTTLYPGTDFGYDKAAWKRWYSESTTPKNVQLRRDL